MPKLEWIKPPQQARSQKTLERILVAAETLIIEKGVEATTVTEIARTAKSSVGAFYARFNDKEALLRTLIERFTGQAIATVDDILQPHRWEGIPFEQVIHQCVSFMLRIFHERRWLIVGFTVRAAKNPGISEYGERLGSSVAERVYQLIEARNEPVSHPNPRAAVDFAVWMVLSALEARALYRSELSVLIADEVISAELTRMALAYLGIDVSAQFEDEKGVHHGMGRLRKNSDPI
jgi:AcrR family transcriptional regulator